VVLDTFDTSYFYETTGIPKTIETMAQTRSNHLLKTTVSFNKTATKAGVSQYFVAINGYS